MRAVVHLLVLLCATCTLAQYFNISSVNYAGIDMIMLDTPAFLTKIERAYGSSGSIGEVLVFGETFQRTVTVSLSASGFVALPLARGTWNYTMIDLHTFFNNSSPYTVGVTNYDVDMDAAFGSGKQVGPYLPLMYFTPTGTQWMQPVSDPITGINWGGIMIGGIRVDSRDFSNVIIYSAGWKINFTDPANSVSFSIFRLHLNLNQGGGLNVPRFYYNASQDFYAVYQNKFAPFNPTFKPFVHMSPNWGQFNYTLVIVGDPNTRTVFTGYFDSNGNFNSFTPKSINTKGYDMVSAAFNSQTQKFIVGLATSGNNTTGAIAVVDIQSPSVPPTIISLPPYSNNPKALALDEDTNELYIALNGGNEVLKLNLNTSTVTGYQRLPEWLHRSWDGVNFHHHIYFITHEQNSKIYRVSKQDFCPSRCPYFGYCNAGACACADGFVMSSDKTQCEWKELVKYETLYTQTHNGEVALGILFMLSFIAAAAGWFLWYRTRRSAYQPV